MFKTEKDIRFALTLDKRFYLDDHWFEESKEKIFTRTWQYFCDAASVSTHGDILAGNLLENFLDVPLLITHDDKQNLNCLSNVCTHRGSVLVNSKCNATQIRCPYHGRKFTLTGECISMPEFEDVPDFPRATDHLPKIPQAEFGNFLFVSLNPRIDFDELVAELRDGFSWLDFRAATFSSEHARDFEVNAHWALYCENYLEGFHIPFVHSSLNAKLDFNSYTTELFRYSSVQIGFAKDEEDAFEIPNDSTYFGKRIAAFYFFLFPNLLLNFYPWGISMNIVIPQTPTRTIIRYRTYISDESKFGKGAGTNLDQVEREDQKVVENVQRGIRSPFYKYGRFSPRREQGVHHFQQLIAEFMN